MKEQLGCMTILALCLLGIGSCVHFYELVVTDEKFEVEAVYYHECAHYSVDYIAPNGDIQTRDYKWIPTRRVPDVPANGKPWVEAHIVRDNYNFNFHYGESHVTIHIRGVKDIHPAGWNHGKFGSGMTTVLEKVD